MTTSVQAFSNNHARIASKSRTFVPNRRTSSAGFRWTGPIRMQTSKNFLPTSIPAHRSTLTSSMTLSLRREANAFLSVLPLGLCCSNRRFVCVSQTTLPNGFFTKNYGRPSLFVPQPCRLQTLLVKVQLFILGGGPKGHEPLPSTFWCDCVQTGAVDGETLAFLDRHVGHA